MKDVMNWQIRQWMKVFLSLALIFLESCSLFHKKVSVEQVKDRRSNYQNINTEHLIMQEKQSLSIAMLQIKHQVILSNSVIIAEAKSLIYASSHGSENKLLKTSILPEAVKLFTLANDLDLLTIVLCKNKLEKNIIKDFLNSHLKNKNLVKYSFATDLTDFKDKNPVAIISENYESLWGSRSTNNLSKKMWYSKWVPLQNDQKSQISKDNWIKFL